MIFAGHDGTGKGETARHVARILSNEGYFDPPIDVGDYVELVTMDPLFQIHNVEGAVGCVTKKTEGTGLTRPTFDVEFEGTY